MMRIDSKTLTSCFFLEREKVETLSKNKKKKKKNDVDVFESILKCNIHEIIDKICNVC